MPRNCHPSKPLPLTTIDKPAEKNEEGDAEANQMEIEEELPAASASDPAAPINVWVGDASDQDSEQRLLGFERFDTHRLGKFSFSNLRRVDLYLIFILLIDSILDTKPGSVLNAGGPVSGLAWCPGVNNTEGSSTFYISQSFSISRLTISSFSKSFSFRFPCNFYSVNFATSIQCTSNFDINDSNLVNRYINSIRFKSNNSRN